MQEEIKVKVCYIEANSDGDKILDTECMREDFDNQMNELINKV